MDYKKHFEFIVILFCLVTLLFLYGQVPFSERLMIVGFSTLSLFYLLSGALVLFNSSIWRYMRLMYFVGLWSISIGLLGTIFKLGFWQNSNLLLMVGFSFGLVLLLFMFSYWRAIKPEAKVIAVDQLKPLLSRLAVYPIIFLLLFNLPNRTLYHWIGDYNDDEKYIQLFFQTLENPEDEEAQEAFEKYKEELEE